MTINARDWWTKFYVGGSLYHFWLLPKVKFCFNFNCQRFYWSTWKSFFKMVNPWPLFVYFHSISNKHCNFYNKLMWCPSVYSTGIRTHDIQNMSLIPKPLDEGSTLVGSLFICRERLDGVTYINNVYHNRSTMCRLNLMTSEKWADHFLKWLPIWGNTKSRQVEEAT